MFLQVISALHDMHTAGFLHRNIKPSNICIGRGTQRRVIYLLDHGKIPFKTLYTSQISIFFFCKLLLIFNI